MTSPAPALTAAGLNRACRQLGAADPDLGRAIERLGPPPMWDRQPGFETLVRIILEQQVSLASAGAAFDKLAAALPKLEPRSFLTLDDQSLRLIGFSSQKGRYCRELAGALLEGALDLEGLPSLSDENVRTALEQVTGIGPWTSNIYLLMVLLRPDVWPPGDLALCKAVQELKGLERPPTREEFESIGEPWRPWRSVAARVLWHHYLNPE